MKIPVGDRMKSISISPDFLQSILNALTPIQIANAFPNYYKRQLPDVSNFITSYITSRNGGNWNQTGGGDDGSASPYYDGETKHGGVTPAGTPPPTIQEMKEKLLKQGIDVDGTLNLVKQGAVLEGDERMAALKGMTDDELKAVGMLRTEDESGKTIIQMAPSQYEGMSEAQVLEEYKKEFPKTNISPRERATLDFIAKREGSKDPNVIFGDVGGKGGTGQYSQQLKNMGYTKPLTEMTITEVRAMQKDLIKLTKGRIGKGDLGTSAVGSGQMIGSTLETNLKALGIPQDQWDNIKFDKDLQDRLTLQNFKTMGIGDPNAPPSTWNHGVLGQQYESLDTRKHPAMSQSEMTDIEGKSAIRPENKDDVTPQEALRKLKEAEGTRYGEELTKKLFNQASPTSSEFPALKDGETRVSIEGEKLRPVGTDYDSLKEFWSQRNPRTDINRVMEVDPDLLKAYAEAVQQYEAANPGLKVELFGPSAASRDSGSTSNHGVKADGYSKALDFAIIDRASGKQITNLGKEGYSGQVGGSEVAAREYTRLHSLARIAQEHYAPHESNLRQGGGFVQGVTADWMHGDIQSENMAAYSWEKGYDPNFRRQYNIQENLILGEEERIKELGQQIYGQVDESGYYTNRADFSQLEDGNTTVVSKKVEKPKDDIVASAQPEPSPVVATPPVSPPVETAPTVTEQTPVAVTQPVAVEPKEVTKEVTVVAATPAESKETTAATPPPPPEDVRKYALGGNIYEPNEDMTLVDTETGNPIAQIGNDEKIEKTGNAIQVTPETKLKADELTNKYDSSTEMEDRMSNIEDNMQSQQSPDKTNQVVQKAKEPEKAQTDPPYRWRESVASAERPVSPSFNRAMARSKFFGEGHHFTRSAPSSQS